MGNRGMSTHGFQITFAVEILYVDDVDGTITKQRYLVTVQMDVVYSQSSEQTLPEVRRLHCSCTHIYLYIYIYMYIIIYVYIYMRFIYICMCVYIYMNLMCIYTYIYIYMYTHICVFICIYMHLMYMYIHAPICPLLFFPVTRAIYFVQTGDVRCEARHEPNWSGF